MADATPRPRLATAWLGGCSGCHMSFLDIDERLLELGDRVTLVFSPIADVKRFPTNVDIAVVEGAVATDEHLDLAKTIRRQSRFVLALGDCAVTGNVTAMRNPIPLDAVLGRTFLELADVTPQLPGDHPTLAQLLPTARPLHECIPVDGYLHGCPPTADQIWFAITELLAGRTPAASHVYLRFG